MIVRFIALQSSLCDYNLKLRHSSPNLTHALFPRTR